MSEYITLKDNRDFSGLYRRGKSFVGPVLVTYVLKNKSDNLRFGITTGKKIGKAVRQHKVKEGNKRGLLQTLSRYKKRI